MTNYEMIKNNDFSKQEFRNLLFRISLEGIHYFDDEVCYNCKKQNNYKCVYTNHIGLDGKIHSHCLYDGKDMIKEWLELEYVEDAS